MELQNRKWLEVLFSGAYENGHSFKIGMPITFAFKQSLDVKFFFSSNREFDDGYKNNLNAFDIFRKLKNERFQPKGTVFVLSDFIGRSNRLSPSDLKMMVGSGMISIQSHTATHPDLTKINNFKIELKESKEKIQHITGKPVIALAYPYGNTDKKVVEETKKYYRFGLTTTPELFSEKGMKDELYFLPRVYITYSTTLDEFAKIVEGE